MANVTGALDLLGGAMLQGGQEMALRALVTRAQRLGLDPQETYRKEVIEPLLEQNKFDEALMELKRPGINPNTPLGGEIWSDPEGIDKLRQEIENKRVDYLKSMQESRRELERTKVEQAQAAAQAQQQAAAQQALAQGYPEMAGGGGQESFRFSDLLAQGPSDRRDLGALLRGLA